MFPYFPCSHLIIEEAKKDLLLCKKTLVKPDDFAQAEVNANDLRQAGTFDTWGCEMLILIFPLPSMPFDESVYIDLISHIKRQTLMRVSTSSVNVIPWCDSFHAHLCGAQRSSFKQSQLLAFLTLELPVVDEYLKR